VSAVKSSDVAINESERPLGVLTPVFGTMLALMVEPRIRYFRQSAATAVVSVSKGSSGSSNVEFVLCWRGAAERMVILRKYRQSADAGI
jgi:hypothetical protein